MPDASKSIAQALHEVSVVERADDDLPEQFAIPEATIPAFRTKVKLYREAIILMLLLAESESDLRFGEVLREYEKIIFGPTPYAASLRKLNEIKTAMRNLNSLLDPEGKSRELTWPKQWLHEIGREEHNPVTLALFAQYWLGEVASIGESIRDIEADQ